MERQPSYPASLQEGIKSDDELAARIGRFATLQELGFFGVKTNVELAKGSYPPRTFIGAVRKRFSGMYGDVEGCSAGDIEVAMELTGSMEDILDYELREKALDE